MKKTVRLLTMAMALVVLCMALASCSKISQSYADKINKAADNKEHYTLEQVRKDLGDEAADVIVAGTGFIIAVKGCTSLDEIEDLIDEGKDVKGIIITFLAGKATGAKYKEITKDDIK